MSKGAHFVCKSLDDLVNDMQDDTCMNKWSNLPDFSCLECNDISLHHLIVLPSECNFGGDRPDVSSIIKRARELSTGKVRYSVMLDIAKGASTGPVDLCKIDPDFSCLSFYKLFGEPTGLGCLFVKRSSIGILMESTTHMYFGGGSVDAVLPTLDFVSPRSEPTPLASLSNGTSHFRGIASLINGFDELGRLGGMEQVRLHTNSLVSELLRRFRNLHHRDGGPVIELYGAWRFYKGDDATCAPGPTIAFNILRANGSNVGYNEVSKLAALNKPPLQLRTGCFCNPGACQLALQITNDAAISNYQNSGHVCGDSIDLINGKPTGCIRCSFGKESIWEDLDELVTFIDHMFVSSTDRATIVESDSLPDRRPREVVVSELYLFPIKSCAAQKVHRWKMAKASGKLLLDREFALVDSLGRAMRLQVFPQMSLIRPTIDLDTQTMHVVAPGCTPLVINLKDTRMTRIETERDNCFVKVCGSRLVVGCATVRFYIVELSVHSL
jgi:molybdenum cofactor sulfurtransferase